MTQTNLEDFDLAGRTVLQVHVFVAVVRVRLYLHPERNAPLATVFARRELGADAVDLDEDAGVFTRVPPELENV